MSKHPPSGQAPSDLPADDLACDPGIGAAKGTTIAGEGGDAIAGENTVEGDVENDTAPGGGIDPRQRGRDHP